MFKHQCEHMATIESCDKCDYTGTDLNLRNIKSNTTKNIISSAPTAYKPSSSEWHTGTTRKGVAEVTAQTINTSHNDIIDIKTVTKLKTNSKLWITCN